MATIEQNNMKTLRPAMNIVAGLDETTETILDGGDATNTYDDGLYDGVSYIDDVVPQIILMDLCNGGFYNDGSAQPISEYPTMVGGTLAGKYGFISSSIADETGTLAAPVQVDITAFNEWDNVTVTLADSKGNQRIEIIDDITWNDGGASLTFDKGWANERLHVLRIALGKSWTFDNSTLIKCSMNLRGVETTADNPELQLSEIEIQAYEPEDYSNIIGRITEGSPIWYQAGYPGDMSIVRRFYLNQKIQYENNVLTIRGYDATYQLEGQYDGFILQSNTNEIEYDYASQIYFIIQSAGIDVANRGLPEIPTGTSDAINLYLDNRSKRLLVANAMNMYREQGFCVNYVDAGIPTFSGIEPLNNTWQISADQVANFKTEIELFTKEVRSVLYSATINAAAEELTTIDVVSGQEYWINLAEPVYSASSTMGTIMFLSPYTLLLTATSTGTASVTGRKIVLSTTSANNPYSATNNERGVVVSLDDQMMINSVNGNRSQTAIDNMLQRSNIMYSFTYRGNPKMQPRDIIEFTYPNGTVEQMTIESLTLEHENGGLTSDIVARKGVV